ncbi:dynein heavy chain [Nesidiocoris tenuis]|uniref:Dynein heavy chain n=1 Tax=Nesidiocoris tenuis TaxID=355587 RepID=A0ABN7ABK4_9HEMI|nr:dynein heavy chain [Nesidiocoris tenuis]
MKAGLTRTYMSMPQEMLEYTNAKPYLPLVYNISFLHSVVQERRRFGPIGWNIPYEFNFSDWYASILFCQNHLDSKERIAGVDWVCLRYIFSEVMYGGRVTDDYDKRLLTTFCSFWFTEDTLDESFTFYKGYPQLRYKNKEEYLEEIAKLPDFDDPFVLGLHPNANITYRTNFATDVLDTILSVQPKESGDSGGESRESVVTREVTEMLSKLPDEYNPHEIKARLKEMGALNSLNIFLRQEMDRMQRVIKLVKVTLKELLLAIEGIIIMNENLREALDAIYDAKVPFVWKRGSWESASLGFWYSELLTRNKQFHTWCYKGRPNSFWMSGFFNPQGFITAMKQEVARAHKGWALDAVYLENKVTRYYTPTVSSGPKEGVYVYGLYLDGCSWDRKQDRLVESIPKVIYTEMPMIHIFAINTTDPRPKDVYTCPVYKKPKRTDLNFITPLWIPCKFTADHWILRGIALLCDIK